MTTKHPEKPYFAASFFYFPQIDFINSKGDIYKSICYKEFISPDRAVESDYCYFDMVCSDSEYVYALYNPLDYNLDDELPIEESSVLVFTWNGEAVCEYKIPYASNICIDSKNDKLYGFDNRTENFIVDIYDLHKL